MNLLAILLIVYAVSFLLLFIGKAYGTTLKVASWGVVAIQFAYIIMRTIEAGHPPVSSTFDAALMASFFLMLLSTIFDSKQHFIRFFLTFSFFTFLYGFIYYDNVRPMIPTEDGMSVYLHVLFVWLSYFFYTLAFVASIVVLMGRNIFGSAVKSENLDEYIYRNILYGIVLQTIMFALGAFHSALVFGNWWNWDPVVFLCMVSYFIYGATIHGVLFLGWEQKTLAKWSVIGFIATILLYWGLIYINFSTFHIFDLALKNHYD